MRTLQRAAFGFPAAVAPAGSPVLAVLQQESTAEVRAALLAATLTGMPTQRILLKDLEANLDTRAALANYTGEILPVGTVEFVRAAMGVRGVPEPDAMGYRPVADFLRREIRAGVLYELKAIEEPIFVKPVATKSFSGFVYDPRAGAEHTEYQAEQLAAIAKLKTSTRVWLSEVVEFVCEWRYYVDAAGRILARARYDADGADDAPEPTAEVVQNAINSTVLYLEARGNAHPFAVDVGVLANGRTAVVELTDAWAIGLYGHARTAAGTAWKPQDYIEFLQQRWRSIVAYAQLHAAKETAQRLVEAGAAADAPNKAANLRSLLGNPAGAVVPS
ncbi:ATP-grasp domain-containing protein [Variovorax sp. LjRoot175]|uniref:ATP-grasp domain-containing protein n=1 Tax=Variovorax sp. LjRoot175 TaxID=3342276 RepID=UPI003ECF88B7